ncbi:2-oxoacid:ferredoxin oxidoreductase subunit beta [Candidatus Woesearchaeota archaeon]|nr:2-oxoacid:ferredoxin oxidoreductase subunit beta [Candidatus Woesearchaeota archaeon]
MSDVKNKLATKNENTWCPGCTNFLILESAKRAIAKLIEEGSKQEDFAMATGIGCHAKMFDYLNISGIYGLHGRVIPTCLGMKLGNPNLKVLGFAGDGDTYAEGMAHFIHVARYNPDMTLIVHDNQNFSLTTGQATPTSQVGYKNKAKPLGEFNTPFNPIKLALASGTSFIARCDSKDMMHMAEILEKAMKHKGFSFVEIIQDCAIFNKGNKGKDELMYKISDNSDSDVARKLAEEWNYNNEGGKIPLGVLYQEEKPTLEDKWPQLTELKEKKVSWKNK